MSNDIEGIEVRLMLEAIRERYGYDFRQYDGPSIRRRVLAAFAKSKAVSLGDFTHELLASPDSFAKALDDMTIRVSAMFRDPDLFLRFRRDVVPVLRTYPHIKVWHAGCATGEEVYTTAILLQEVGLYERAQIYATDISARALALAREGVYPESVFERYDANYREAGGTASLSEYCSTGYGHFTVRDSLRKNIVFFQHDLVSDYALGEMQVIFCRNVLIYFQEDLRRKVVSLFSDCLCHGGFLCLGASESVPQTSTAALKCFAHKERIFQRKEM